MEDKIKGFLLAYERFPEQSINAPIAKIKKLLEDAYIAGQDDSGEFGEVKGFEKWFNNK